MRKSDGRRLWTLPPATLALATATALALTACGDFWKNVPPRPAASTDPAIDAAEFPSINSVPARPQLSYPLTQRREIAEGLVADRANARHVGDALRRETGRPVPTAEPVPLPPAAPTPVAVAPGAGTNQRGALALAYVEEALAREDDSGSLDDFLERLQQPPVGPGPRSAERAAAAAAAQQQREQRGGRPAGTAAPTPEQPLEGDEPADAVGGDALQAIEPAAGAAVTAPAASRAATAPAADATPAATTDIAAARPTAEAAAPGATAGPAPAAPQLPMAVLFAAEDTLIDDHATEKLRALARANKDVPQLLVVGNGPRPGLAMERARRVAALLVDAGIPSERLILEMGGESDVVVVYEPDGVAG